MYTVLVSSPVWFLELSNSGLDHVVDTVSVQMCRRSIMISPLALRIIHSYTLDTSVLLKDLSTTYLNIFFIIPFFTR